MDKDISFNTLCKEYGLSKQELEIFLKKGLFGFGDRDDTNLKLSLNDKAKLKLAIQIKEAGVSLEKTISILQDTTIYKQNENSKTKLFYDSFYYELFSNSPSFLIITDDKGNIIDMNQAVREKLGYGDEMIGKSLLELHPEDVRLEATENLYKILNGDLEYCPLDILSKDGRRIGVESKVVMLENNGHKLFLALSQVEWVTKKSSFSLYETLFILPVPEERYLCRM